MDIWLVGWLDGWMDGSLMCTWVRKGKERGSEPGSSPVIYSFKKNIKKKCPSQLCHRQRHSSSSSMCLLFHSFHQYPLSTNWNIYKGGQGGRGGEKNTIPLSDSIVSYRHV